VHVNDIEIKGLGKAIPTYYLMLRLEKSFPDKDFYFVIGTDLVESLVYWDGKEEFVKNTKFIIYPRAGHYLKETTNLPPQHWLL
jgi:nicotinate-nucleotide adenylyltransferase